MIYFSSKYLPAVMVVLVFTMTFAMASLTTIKVDNPAPVFEDMEGNTIEPSDGGLDKSNPVSFGDIVTFTATATDANGDDYYLAICRTDEITPQDSAPPICDGGEWGISPLTKNGSQVTVIYETCEDVDIENQWYAFVCDHVTENSNCSKSSQGSGTNGSPFYVSKQVGSLVFGNDCPELKELNELTSDFNLTDPTKHHQGLAKLYKPLSKRQVKQLIKAEFSKDENDDVSADLKLVADKVKDLRKINKTGEVTDDDIDETADFLLNKRKQLLSLAQSGAKFCVNKTTDDELCSIAGEKNRTAKKMSQHKVERDGLKIKFNKDDKRTIDIDFLFRKGQKKIDPESVTGPEITYKDPDPEYKFTGPKEMAKKRAEQTVDTEDIYKTITITRETYEAPAKEPGLLSRLFGTDEEPQGRSQPVTFDLNVLNPKISKDKSEDEVVYQGSDNRITEIYKYTNEPDSVSPHILKNYTVFHYGDGTEDEIFSFENAVLRIRDDGTIEGYFAELPDLSNEPGADQVSNSLLDRASRTLARDMIENLHTNGKDNPDFIIKAPFALDNENNIIENLTYEVIGDKYNQLRITFSADTDDYPIALDPQISFVASSVVGITSDKIAGSTGSGEAFGTSIAVGDLNADGKDDLLVGSYYTGSGDGAAFVFYNDGSYPENRTGADATFTGESGEWAYFGDTVHVADMNADGKEDVIVGAYDYYSGSYNTGRTYIFYNHNGEFGNSFCTSCAAATDSDVIIEGENDSAFGAAITSGDLNADGVIDLVVGANGYTSYTGRAYIFYSDGTNNFGTTTCSGTPSICYASNADAIITGESGSEFALALATGDFDSDGDTDLAVGAEGYSSYRGRAYIFYSNGDGTFGTSSCSTACSASTDADETITGEDNTITGCSNAGYFGHAIAVGDMNNDTRSDLIISAYWCSTYAGRVYIFNNDGSYTTAAGSADSKITSDTTNTLFGADISTGDLNNDGETDLVVGGDWYVSYTGRAWAFYNDGSSWPTTAANADIVITGENTSDWFGYGVDVADMNADGLNDFVVSSVFGDSDGYVQIFYGSGGIELGNQITGEASTYFGLRFRIADVNSDGTDDLIAGGQAYNSNQGRAYIFYNDGNYQTGAASADVIITGNANSLLFGRDIEVGDFDADGDNDIAIGAGYDHATNLYGAVYIFYQDATTWGTVSCTTGCLASNADHKITGESEAYNMFGRGLAKGDMDGDGDTDLVVAARGRSSNTGYVYIFYNDGSYPSLATGADVTIAGETGSYFGRDTEVGDLDGDGDDDLACGALNYNTQVGRAYIFYNDGSWPSTAATADVIIDTSTSDNLGAAIAIGDLNSDNFDDIAIGAGYYAGTSQGATYIFYNDGTPHFGTTTCTGSGPYYCSTSNADETITGEGGAIYGFGTSLHIDDINSDGDDDLIVGASHFSSTTGWAYIFYNDGSYTTSATSADVRIAGETSTDYFATWIETGDLNSDGNTDLLVDSYTYNSNAGRIDVFYGDDSFDWYTEYPWRQYNVGRYRGGNRHVIEGFEDGGKFGTSIATGDFDGNGRKDLAVGSSENGAGRVDIFLNNGSIPRDTYSANVTIEGATSGDQFGYSLAAGKVSESSDTIDDLVIGAPSANSNYGYVYIFNGRAEWSRSYSASSEYSDRMVDSASGYRCGHAVLAGTDIIGDGREDIVFSCPGTIGSSNGARIDICDNDGTYPSDSSCSNTIISTSTNKGASIAVGDVNADGMMDLVTGDPAYNSNAGAVYVYYGTSSKLINTSPGTTITGNYANAQFGFKVAAAEMDYDGKTDIIASSPYYDSGSPYNNGAVQIFYNDGSYPATSIFNPPYDWYIVGNEAEYMGKGLGVGDMNRNGRTDLIASLPGYSSGYGGVMAFYNTGTMTISDILLNNTGTDTSFGSQFVIDDLDGDGWNEVITSAPDTYAEEGAVFIYDYTTKRFPGTTSYQWGHAIAIGDYDGDGDNDLAIGAPGYSSNTGQVHIWFDDVPGLTRMTYPTADVIITGSAGSKFGYSLDSGEVSTTADTIDDLVIGAPGYNSSDGAIYIFNGRTAWGSTYSYASASTSIIGTSGKADGYGTAVLADADINGDGRDDIIASSPDTRLGTINIYYNDGAYGGADDSFDGNNDLELFGYALATGDFDSDGDPDIAVSTPLINTNAGLVSIAYNDGSFGLDVNISGESASKFGYGLTAGDFDGDGDDDLAVGAPEYSTNTGKAYIFYQDGSWPTTASTADVTITGASSSYFGQSVGALDLNLDNSTDLVVGAESAIYGYFNDGTYADLYSEYDYWNENLKTSYAYSSLPAEIGIGDLSYDGNDDIVIGMPGDTSGTGYVHYYRTIKTQCEPANPASMTITDTGGFTNDPTPTISVTYAYDTGVTGNIPELAVFSCNNGASWSGFIPLTGSGSPVSTSSFDMVNDDTAGCTTSDGSRTIRTRIITGCAAYQGDYVSDTTYYDSTGPTVVDLTTVVDSTSQITVTAGTTSDGSGSADPYQYYFTPTGCTGSVVEHPWTSDGDNDDVFTGLTANTQYAFRIKARDELENEGSYTSCDTAKYTHANTPGVPTVSGATSSTLDVDPASGGAESAMAIYAAPSAEQCYAASGGGYVQYSDGSIGVSADWQTEATWGNKTVTGLSSSTTYWFCVKARNGDSVETGFGTAASGTTSSGNTAPSFTIGPSDNGSSSTTPTNAGNNVNFTATATDGETNQWYLAVCKTNSVTPGNDAAPTCATDQTWAISSATASGAGASVNYPTTGGDAESNVWYAFACDKVAGGGLCSSSSQGTGDNGSPFNVNHAPEITAVIADADGTGGTESVDPGDPVYFRVTVTETDTDGGSDTVDLHVCATNSFTSGSGCAASQTICKSVGQAAGTLACNSGDLSGDVAGFNAIPQSHGSHTVYIFAEDSHDFQATYSSGDQTRTYSVTDVDPFIDSYIVSPITLTAGSSTAKQYTVTVSDDNGDDDITSVTAALYQTTTHTLSSGLCNPEDENECYNEDDDSCALSDQSGSDINATATCDFTVWFNAYDSTTYPWKMHANPSDGVAITTETDSGDITVNALSAINIPETSLAYGTLTIGQLSDEKSITIENLGNQPFDTSIQGTNMTYSTYTIDRSYQKWSDTQGFSYSSGYSLVETATTTGPATGCFDNNVAVRNNHASGSGSDDTMYIRLLIPFGQHAATYSGTNTFSTITCD